ncbi:DUF7525 family protein [Halorarum halobium]|uniref:DUF7525 family protein n=1 Tax=Halorarum halobium TaxID=3075121 RepID=UPI0028A7AD5A|nr:hypothetical protein [Halobaculum sp. XH14]
MTSESVSSDMGTGLALVFGALVTVGAGLMVAGGTQQVMAWGFALAMLAGGLAVTAVHVYA